ncbi:MAG: ferredoxin [Betaproteobacteria bacterium]|nr:ferredoxin [Betaproteobacteria bacterium]
MTTTKTDDNQVAPKSFRIILHQEKCIGAGHCVTCAPDIFGQNEDDGVVILLNDNPPPDRLAAVESAARMCPTGVIQVTKEE